jgi:predicted RNase H-like HicB family nuclease
MTNHNLYTYTVTFSPEDNEFVGRCVEFPSLSHLDPDAELAIAGIRNLVESCLLDMEENGETAPASSRHIGSSFESFLDEEDIKTDVALRAALKEDKDAASAQPQSAPVVTELSTKVAALYEQLADCHRTMCWLEAFNEEEQDDLLDVMDKVWAKRQG